jgi:hypothetical protein
MSTTIDLPVGQLHDALIGYSGFVGGALRAQHRFDSLYRSTNIGDIDGKHFNLVVCAGVSAKKWLAIKEPEADRKAIDGLIEHLRTIRCEHFVLISTVDVFRNPQNVDEGTAVVENGLNAYGLNRRLLETFVEGHFPNRLIVRLPGLVGPGLRKNIIFDFLNNNNISAVDSRGVFQFYPTVNTWYDISIAMKAGLDLVHLTAEPISTRRVAREGFGLDFDNELSQMPSAYDMRSRHAALFGGAGGYQYSESIQAIRCYAQSEPLANGTNR